MAKAKGSKGKSVPHKHLHARLSYLHQASSYVSLAKHNHKRESTKRRGSQSVPEEEELSHTRQMSSDYAQSRHLLNQLRAVSLKAQIRLAPQLKHSICKRCNSLLVAGKSSTERINNESKGGAKDCADVLVIECFFCGTVKRFAVGLPKRSKKPLCAGEEEEEQRPKNVVPKSTP